jgi:hypothetical protein
MQLPKHVRFVSPYPYMLLSAARHCQLQHDVWHDVRMHADESGTDSTHIGPDKHDNGHLFVSLFSQTVVVLRRRETCIVNLLRPIQKAGTAAGNVIRATQRRYSKAKFDQTHVVCGVRCLCGQAFLNFAPLARQQHTNASRREDKQQRQVPESATCRHGRDLVTFCARCGTRCGGTPSDGKPPMYPTAEDTRQQKIDAEYGGGESARREKKSMRVSFQ